MSQISYSWSKDFLFSNTFCIELDGALIKSLKDWVKISVFIFFNEISYYVFSKVLLEFKIIDSIYKFILFITILSFLCPHVLLQKMNTSILSVSLILLAQ